MRYFIGFEIWKFTKESRKLDQNDEYFFIVGVISSDEDFKCSVIFNNWVVLELFEILPVLSLKCFVSGVYKMLKTSMLEMISLRRLHWRHFIYWKMSSSICLRENWSISIRLHMFLQISVFPYVTLSISSGSVDPLTFSITSPSTILQLFFLLLLT